MAVQLSRRVDFPMIDMAGVSYYPRIYDLAHRFFEDSWAKICGIDYPTIINEMRLGFPVVDVKSKFIKPLRYGDEITANITISHVGDKSCTWNYSFYNQKQELLWESQQVTVCVSMDTMESKTIPDDLKTGLVNLIE
jgi:4-hydroxybenzoyl-CoA thioesterase